MKALVKVRQFTVCCHGKEGPFLGFLFATFARECNRYQAASGWERIGAHTCVALQLCVVTSFHPSC